MTTDVLKEKPPSEGHSTEDKSWPQLEIAYSIQDGQMQEVLQDAHIQRKNLGPLTMVAVGFNICNSWVAIASSLAIAVSAGGPVNIIYGTFFALFFYACVAVSLAELASVYPTAGGQYHFASIVAPKKWARGMSYVCGIVATASWVALTASATLLGAQMILALPAFYVEGFAPEGWHYFLVYQAINFILLLYNMFVMRFTPRVHDIGFYLTLSAFVAVSIAVLAVSDKQSSEYVWATFENNTGWPSAIAFLTGLSTPCFMYAGIDATLHLAETCTNPRSAVPRALMVTVTIGFITGFVFSVAMCYGISDLEDLVNTTMPIYTLWRQALRSSAAAAIFLVALILILFFVVTAMQQTTSRLVHAFGRDNGLLFSSHLGQISPSLQVPIYALLCNAVCVFAAGCIYLGSPTAFTSLINTSIILQMLSFGIPCALLMWRGRSEEVLPRKRQFWVPGVVGWIANAGTVLGAVFELVFFCFPGAVPVTGTTMNYAAVVLAVIAVIATVNWFAHARKHYNGPRIVMD
ncbi:Choline transport protein [Cercospora beticola]|uniref:Choline transport protein n=1 Tax=Cercospora beticola TaxID=122368 RepID=A0A2G5HT90_CERBT|nr:Choline transport protein [Cercospora beticola]PIA95754.1 Choline transport protein [Cercospora beticola]WPB06789.1 hypothetical protein RHO25_011449 [Cercospora beticola]